MKTSRLPVPLLFASGLVMISILSLVYFYFSMHPPMGDLSLMAVFLATTAAISGLVGLISYRLGWLNRSPSLKISLLSIYAIASLLTIFNVWVTARLMFASQHDLQLAAVLLVFAAGIAMLLGYFLSIGITHRIAALKMAANRLAAGDLSTRAQTQGHDEVAALAHSFNHMAEQLQQADAAQRELDALRRELVAWATHDLQTPLTAIRVQIEALADGMVDDPATTRRYLTTTRRQVDELSRLIDDLFQVAQLDAGGMIVQPVTCSLGDLISDTLESFTALANESGVMLNGSVTTGVDPVQLDCARVGRLLNNLVGNAIRYTPSGGCVTLTAWREESVVKISVSDSGEGISEEDLPHIFDRFYRGEKSRNRGKGGAGLGLAIAQGIAKAHGGSISVQSNPTLGTIFIVTLPA